MYVISNKCAKELNLCDSKIQHTNFVTKTKVKVFFSVFIVADSLIEGHVYCLFPAIIAPGHDVTNDDGLLLQRIVMEVVPKAPSFLSFCFPYKTRIGTLFVCLYILSSLVCTLHRVSMKMAVSDGFVSSVEVAPVGFLGE